MANDENNGGDPKSGRTDISQFDRKAGTVIDVDYKRAKRVWESVLASDIDLGHVLKDMPQSLRDRPRVEVQALVDLLNGDGVLSVVSEDPITIDDMYGLDDIIHEQKALDLEKARQKEQETLRQKIDTTLHLFEIWEKCYNPVNDHLNMLGLTALLKNEGLNTTQIRMYKEGMLEIERKNKYGVPDGNPEPDSGDKPEPGKG